MAHLDFNARLLCSCALVLIFSGAAQPALAQTAGDKVETVVVTGIRQEEAARELQKQAPNLINVQSAEAIIKYPDFNAAESLSRMPGISLLADTGEGRFVNVRGLDGNLNGATYGGIPLLNTFPGGTYDGGGGRAVEFDTVPDGAIDGIIVTKTGMPDQDAEGLGGTIELKPRSAADIAKPFADITLGAGDEPEHSHTGPFNAELAVGARFGFNQNGLLVENGQTANQVNPGWVSNPTPFSFVLDGSWRTDMRGFDDIEEDYTNEPFNPAGPLDKTYADLQLRHYDYHRRRFGYGGEFDFKPNPDNRFYVRANVFGYVESVIKNHLVYNNIDGSSGYPISVDPSNPHGIATQADLQLNGTNEEETHRNGVFAVGGEDNFDWARIDYHVAYSRATYDMGRNYGVRFTGPQGVAITYDNITSPNFPGLKVTDGTNVNDASLYTLARLNNGSEKDDDQEWSYAGNAQIPVDVFSDADRLKFGFEVRLRTKNQNQYNESFSAAGGGSVGSLNLSLASLSPLKPDTTYYHNRYTNGPGINEYAILGLVKNGTIVASGMQFDPTGYFNADENIYAGYGMYTGDFGPWGVLAGVRVESTNAKYGFYNFDQNGNPVPPPDNFTRLTHNYTNVFPTLQLRYNFTSDLIARATYSTGVGRPGFNQVAGATTVDATTGHISTGNPDLKPTTGNNFDLDVEYYLNDGGIAQFGAFDKEFQDYIFSREIIVNGGDPRLQTLGYNGTAYLDSYDNIGSSYARGIEAAYQQKFAFLPKPFDGLGLDGNITLVTSSGAVRQGEKHFLPGTSATTFNVGAFYEAYGVSLRLAGQFVSHSLYQIGGDAATDQYVDSDFNLDFTSSYDVADDASVYFNVKNITNAPHRIFMGYPNWVIQREFYDQTYETGVRIKL
ncbi:MAG: TonB-dependent receptor [Alphaproteobacteria bacterium]|nr:TonB-dependent receptor [Alphaproteobacteria bacterium]MDE2111329.1 TonB-dependent receptor [Alphaproteobacteria bacterium]MDE2495618.1 TonB-dependent receptor [Alphaproteobacteria bacterium]